MYHLTARGVRQAPIFLEDDDYRIFIRILAIAKNRYPFVLQAYCLMTNHIHLLLTTIEYDPAIFMKFLLGSYAKTFNEKYGYSGHLFQGRYHPVEIKDDRQLLATSRYIHLNPVRAGMVSDPALYPYSSYGVYIGECNSELVDKKPIQSLLEDDEPETYRRFCISTEENAKYMTEAKENHVV